MKHQQGFTLIELAIVLVIVTILVGGLAMPLSAQIQARRIAETNKTLAEAREAILGFAMTHSCTCQYDNSGVLSQAPLGPPPQSTCTAQCAVTGPNSGAITRPYLPCPDTNGDGTENRSSGKCSQERGFFPWRDLGTASQDAWGNRIRYAVIADLANATIGFHNTSSGTWNQILSSTAQCSLTPPTVDVATNVPVVLISHGPNSRGARNVNIPLATATPAAPATTGANELQNLGTPQNTCTTSSFISANPTDAFDDLVTWLPFTVLISRVCPNPGGCP